MLHGTPLPCNYCIIYTALLVHTYTETDVPTTVSDPSNMSPDLESIEGEQQGPETGQFMIPASVAAAVGSVLLITAAIMAAVCVWYHWRRRKGG